jgi:hypothetical protein
MDLLIERDRLLEVLSKLVGIKEKGRLSSSLSGPMRVQSCEADPATVGHALSP